MRNERENPKFVGVIEFFYFSLLSISILTDTTFNDPDLENHFLKRVGSGTSKH